MAARTAEREQFLADIITTAIEGGTGYWAQVLQYQYSLDDGEVTVYAGALAEGHIAHAILRPIDDPDAEGMELTLDDIARGIGKITRGDARINPELRRLIDAASRENDAGDIDADAADAITQIALLGELTYG